MHPPDDEINFARTFSMGHSMRRPKSVWSNPDKWKTKIITTDLMYANQASLSRFKDRGRAQRIVKSWLFEWSSFLVISANAIWIGIDTDLNTAELLVDASPGFQLVEHLFCAFFFAEWLIRFKAYKSLHTASGDAWFLFDTVLVTLMVSETWILTFVLLLIGPTDSLKSGGIIGLVSLLRLSRMARLARLLRSNPELLIMIKGIMAAMKSVMITFGLQLAIIYVSGIGMKQLTSDTSVGQRHFGSVFQAMYSLAMHATLLDSPAAVLEALWSESFFATALFSAVILVSALLLLNMLVGVLCEVVSNVSKAEKESLDALLVKDKVLAVFQETGLDVDGNGLISKNELMQVLENDSATSHLREAGIDVLGLIDFADVLFQSDTAGQEFEKQLSTSDFIKLVLQLRGSNTATVKDVVDLRKWLHTGRTESNSLLERIEDRLRHVEKLVIGRTASRRSNITSRICSNSDLDGEDLCGSRRSFFPPDFPGQMPSSPEADSQASALECSSLLNDGLQSLRAQLDASQSRLRLMLPPLDVGVDGGQHGVPQATHPGETPPDRGEEASDEACQGSARPDCDQGESPFCQPQHRGSHARQLDGGLEAPAVYYSRGVVRLPNSVKEEP